MTGFDILLGNPPWEQVKIHEREWFSSRSKEISEQTNSTTRAQLISRLEEEDPILFLSFVRACELSERVSHFLRNSGRFPLCARGDINVAAPFAELFAAISRRSAGCVIPATVLTGHTCRGFFEFLLRHRWVKSIHFFDQRASVFDGVNFDFCLLSLSLQNERAVFDVASDLRSEADLKNSELAVELSVEDIALVNPNTRTCPNFRTRRDAEIIKGIYRRVPILVDETREDGNPWGVKFSTMFHMSNDSGLFRTRPQLESDGWALSGNIFEHGGERMLPLYEAKMIHHYDHRWATYEGGRTRLLAEEEKTDPSTVVQPRYWVSEPEVDSQLAKLGWQEDWLLGWRDITNPTNERTVIATIIPRVAVGNKLPLIFFEDPSRGPLLQVVLCSFAFDFVARNKMPGTTLNFFLMKQLPVPPPGSFCGTNGFAWLRKLWTLSTVLNNQSMVPGPLTWRMSSRAGLDAGVFHLFGIERDDVDYILDTFSIVRRRDEQRYGSYRTKELILERYDRMAKCRARGEEYQPDWPDKKTP